MKQTYRSPTLTEYGRARDLTLGSSGGSPDYIVIGVPVPNAPTCPAPPGSACIQTSPP